MSPPPPALRGASRESSPLIEPPMTSAFLFLPFIAPVPRIASSNLSHILCPRRKAEEFPNGSHDGRQGCREERQVAMAGRYRSRIRARGEEPEPVRRLDAAVRERAHPRVDDQACAR